MFATWIRSIAAFAAGSLLLSGCRGAALAYGPDAASASANADGLASAMEQRFTRVVRDPKFLYARMRIARFVFAPSKLANDTALWTAMRTRKTGADRDLEISGATVNGQYAFTTRPAAVPARVGDRIGDARHYIGLTQLNGDDDWQWTTTVDHVVGPMPPARATDVMRALFASAERSPSAVRADYRAAFPRASAAFGRMVAVDSIITLPESDGSMLVALHFLVSDARLTSSPALAKFIRRYIESARYHLRLTDGTGAAWLDVDALRSRVIVRFRSHDGELQPMTGVARRMPDTLAIHMDATAKLSFFTVGFSNLEGEFVQVRSATERGWAMRFRREPTWQLPPLTEQLLHSPLKRPFAGDGAQFRLGFTRVGAGPTLLTRTFTLAVQESAIMRVLGSLGFTAMSDYAGTVEEEENRFLAEGFAALRADLRADLGAVRPSR